MCVALRLARGFRNTLKPTFCAPTTRRPLCTKMASGVLEGSDPEQIRLMAEKVILVDEHDDAVGHMSKKDAHLISNNLPLHRAFSVFLFDKEGRMLLQQRASTKITFPSYWTNTVCSHPLYTSAELGEEDGGDKFIGAKRAAIRKLAHELGVVPGDITLGDLKYMTRILYRAECDDGVWGEHELDYIFVAQKDVSLKPEPNEVENVRFVSKEDLQAMFVQAESSDSLRLTPWFRHIVQNFGWAWWDKLLAGGISNVEKASDAHSIHKM